MTNKIYKASSGATSNTDRMKIKYIYKGNDKFYQEKHFMNKKYIEQDSKQFATLICMVASWLRKIDTRF